MPANFLLWRQALGVLFLLDLLCYLPYGRVCLGPGYWKKTRWTSRAGMIAVVVAWLGGALSLLMGVYPLIGAGVLLVLFRHFYIDHRWKNLFRGGGAPGFMSHHQALFLFLFELTAFLDTEGTLVDRVFLMYRVDLAVILMCSGTYKALSGYLHGEGMEYGLANPFWGYWFNFFRRLRPDNLFLRFQNVSAPLTQVAMGICLLIPAVECFGALLCMGTFLYLALVVRLGRLAFLMAAAPLLFVPELPLTTWEIGATLGRLESPDWLIETLGLLPIAYIVVLPFVKVMQYANLFLKKQMPRLLQRALTAYANRVPIIMWRVFTPDVTNFFVRIYAVRDGIETPLAHEESTYSYGDWHDVQRKLRFLHVTESIAQTTVFTTLKYFASDRGLFEKKLLEYAGTLRGGPRSGSRQTSGPAEQRKSGDFRYVDIVRFEYVAIRKTPEEFAYVPVCEFLVDLENQTVEERVIEETFSYHEAARFSHIKETVGYGSYVPR